MMFICIAANGHQKNFPWVNGPRCEVIDLNQYFIGSEIKEMSPQDILLLRPPSSRFAVNTYFVQVDDEGKVIRNYNKLIFFGDNSYKFKLNDNMPVIRKNFYLVYIYTKNLDPAEHED